MSHLAEVYSLGVGAPLSKPEMADAFYPLVHPLDRVILVHAFAGAITEQNGQRVAAFSAKLYDNYNEVLDLLRPVVEAAGYRFYQIGGPGEPGLRGIESLCGRTNLHQCAYLVKNCAALLGNDSMWAHLRGAYGGALVALYGPTSKPHHPYWQDPAKTVLLESHRGGGKPSYASQEHPKTINWIAPETAANAVLSLLGLPAVARQSVFFGDAYQQNTVEVVPDMVLAPNVQVNGPVVVRTDYVTDLDAATDHIAGNLQLRKCVIVLDREVNLNLLRQFKGNVAGIKAEVDHLSPEYVRQLKRLGIGIGFFTNEQDAAKVAATRLRLYEALHPTGADQLRPPTKDDFLKGASTYLNKTLDKAYKTDTLRVRSNKLLLSGGKIHLSKAHWRAGITTPSPEQNSGNVLDMSEFWQEQHHHYLYTE